LVRAGKELAGDADQVQADALRFPALQGGIAAEQGHPAQGVIGQDGALEQGGIGQEVVGLELGEAHLVLRFLDPGFGRGALTVGAMGRPGAKGFAGDVAEGVIPHHRQEFRL